MNSYATKQNDGKSGEASQLLRSSDGSLMLKKLRELFPVMLLNRISLMVMLSVDSVVVGWRIGEGAVASVNYLRPFNSVIGALVVLVSNGVATLMSKQLGANDAEGMERKKKATVYMTLLLSAVLSVIQIPVCLILFRLYGMDDAVYGMALRYAYATMLVTPFSIMNTIGSYLLTSTGRAKAVLHAALLQSVVNVVLDVIFVFGFGMSTDGVGFGTLGAGIAYWVYIMRHLLKHSEFLKINRSVECRREMLDILKYGTPSLISTLADAVFGTILFWFISKRLSDAGVSIHAVCLFAASLATVINLSLRGAMQSLTGMLSTIGDAEGMHRLLKKAVTLCLGLSGGISLLAEFMPSLFFRVYGYHEISDVGIAALRAYAPHFFLMGINGLLQLYFTCWDDEKFASMHSSLSSLVLPAAFATVFFLFGAPWTIWLCYGLADAICLAIAWRRYLRKYRSERAHAAPNEFNIITHPDKASQSAAQLDHILREGGISHSLANRVALCVEEIGAYAVPVRENAQVTIQLYACVSEEETTIIMLDDGQCVAFPKDNQESVLTANNYEMLKRIASECTYDYILDLNRFTVKLRSKKGERICV